MFLFCLHKDQNIVQVHHYNPFGYESSENVVHHSLEGGRTIGHFKEHHERFEEAVVGTEGCFPFISRLYAYIIETPSDVKFCEVLGSMELEDEFGDKKEGVSVLDSYSVERVQKGIAHWDKQNHAVPAPNCVLKVRGEIIKDEGL